MSSASYSEGELLAQSREIEIDIDTNPLDLEIDIDLVPTRAKKTNFKNIYARHWKNIESNPEQMQEIESKLMIEAFHENASIELIDKEIVTQLNNVDDVLRNFFRKADSTRIATSDCVKILNRKLRYVEFWLRRRNKLHYELINFDKICKMFVQKRIETSTHEINRLWQLRAAINRKDWIKKSEEMERWTCRNSIASDIPIFLEHCRLLLIKCKSKLYKQLSKAEIKDEQLALKKQFDVNASECLKTIFSNASQKTCRIEKEMLNDFWRKENESKGVSDTTFLPRNLYDASEKVTLEKNNKANSAITMKELEYVISRLKTKKATGPDNIPNEFWKLNSDHIRKWLFRIFQLCLNLKKIPNSWKAGITVLFHKSGDENDCRNWRPITLLNTIYKVLATIISNRIQYHWIPSISKHQKGFQNINGCHENLMNILRMMEADALERDCPSLPKLQTLIFFIDFRNAFGSTEHKLIFDVLKMIGADSGPLVELIKDIYTNSTFQIQYGKKLLTPINRGRGVFQGDPLSPSLFLLAIDPILRWIHQDGEGFEFFRIAGRRLANGNQIKTSLGSLGYADDMAFIRRHLADIKLICNKLKIVQDKLLIVVNARKCGVMASGVTLEEYTNARIWIDSNDSNSMIPYVSEYKYLGLLISSKLFSRNARANAIEEIESKELQIVRDKAANIHHSSLSVTQKLKALKWIACGRIRYLAPVLQFSRKFIAKCNSTLRIYTRKIFRLPNGTLNAVFHIPPSWGGFGLPILHKDLAIQKLKFWTSIMAKEGISKDIFIMSLFNEAHITGYHVKTSRTTQKYRGLQTSTDNAPYAFFRLYPSGMQNGNKFRYAMTLKGPSLLNTSYWQCAVIEMFSLGITVDWTGFKKSIGPIGPHLEKAVKCGIRIKIEYNDGQEIYHDLSTSASKKQLKLTEKILANIKKDPRQCEFASLQNKEEQEKRGHSGFKAHFFSKLSQKESERQLEMAGMAKLLSTYNPRISDSAIRFIVKARFNIVGNAVYKRIYNIRSSSKCPRNGCNEEEWTSHIISGCFPALYKKRHDAVQNILTRKIEGYCQNIIIDKATLDNSMARPDISYC